MSAPQKPIIGLVCLASPTTPAAPLSGLALAERRLAPDGAAVTSDRVYPLEYKHYFWGELIYATKEQMQDLGIGIGNSFPGEPDGPKRQITVRDPRGFQAVVDRASEGERYCARIWFPGRGRPKLKPTEFAPGVRIFPETLCHDEYTGTADALIAAGLFRAEHLPGAPGMRKVRVTILPDGTIPNVPTTASIRGARDAGAKRIERVSKSLYTVSVWLPEDEIDRRRKLARRAEDEYQAKMEAMPRPAPLALKVSPHANVVNLEAVRFARRVEARKPENNADQILMDSNGEKRRLLWVSLRESNLLSTIYEHRFEEAVVLLREMMGRPS